MNVQEKNRYQVTAYTVEFYMKGNPQSLLCVFSCATEQLQCLRRVELL